MHDGVKTAVSEKNRRRIIRHQRKGATSGLKRLDLFFTKSQSSLKPTESIKLNPFQAIHLANMDIYIYISYHMQGYCDK